MEVNFIILAAGQGTRLKLSRPKMIVPLCGLPLLHYVLRTTQEFQDSFLSSKSRPGVVLGHEKEQIEETLTGFDCQVATQKSPLGTADAVASYFRKYPAAKKTSLTFILCGDAPCLSAEDLKKLYDEVQQDKSLSAVLASFSVSEPSKYGRIIRQGKSFQIREFKDASEEERKVNEVNSGLYLVKTDFLVKQLETIDSNNQAQEFYLTDLFNTQEKTQAIHFSDSSSFVGVNDQADLHLVKRILTQRNVRKWMEQGVYFEAPDQVVIDDNVSLSEGVVIGPQVQLLQGTTIQANSMIEQGSILKASQVGKSCHIKAYSYIDRSQIGASVALGPFAHLRPESIIGNNAKVGNFVEVKKSQLGEGVKVSHLSYVGDTEIGKNTNIGCGFVSVNYDGIKKYKTVIGENSFVGSGVQVIAPIEIGNQCFIAAGSTINQAMEDGSFSIARGKQVTKEGLAKKFLKKDL